ncbi:MAG TPA: glycosyltransferase family 1 protein [Bryobacteraceae bacterium]|nr:glycosyltransferase family 1 protein [Bryobacteraceae bacterium]
MPPLRIGVNALYLIPGGVGGTEIYLRGLLAALAEIDPANQYFVFTNRETGSDLTPARPNFTHVPQPIHAAFRPMRILWEQTALPVATVRRSLDVLLNAGFTAPLLAPCPQVTVFHDLQHVRHPEYFRFFDLPFWRFLLFWSAHVSRLVLVGSAVTAADVLEHYRLPESKVRIARLGVDPIFFDIARRRCPEPFLLTVSTLHPHKNLDGLLRAFAELRRERPEFRFIVCGLHGFVTDSLFALRDSLGLADAVDFPGWIPRDELHDLYARAWAFVYPSLFEGFGIPVLEAMAAAVPTTCSAIEPIRATAGDAALLFDPRDPVAITEALRRITGDVPLRTRLSEAGPRQAAQFTWKATAEVTLEALRDACRDR